MVKAVPRSLRFRERGQEQCLSVVGESQKIFWHLNRYELMPRMTGSYRFSTKMLVRNSIHSSTDHDYILQLGRKKLLRQKLCVYAISLKILDKTIYNNISYAWINRVCTLMWRAKPRYNLNMVLLFSCLVVSDSLQPQWRLKSVRLPCHSLPPRVYQTHVHWVDDAI